MIRQVNSFTDVEERLDKALAPVVYFTASWCGPCKLMKPEFVRAGGQDADREYLILDIDNVESQILDDLAIQSVPTIIMFRTRTDGVRIISRKTSEILEEVSTADNYSI